MLLGILERERCCLRHEKLIENDFVDMLSNPALLPACLGSFAFQNNEKFLVELYVY